MARASVSRAVSVVLLFTVAAARSSRAQPAPAPPAPSGRGASSASPSGEEPASTDEAKEAARAHFEKGVALMDQRAWAAALAEFTLSRKLYPTRSATVNAAICLRTLQRSDEALEMFETLLREFPNLPAEDKTLAQDALAELRGQVGTIEITDARRGAAIVIDGRDRGEYPPVNPLRVAAGTHTVRVFKEGFAPAELRVDVAGGETVRVPAKLLVLTASGRLRVLEQKGQSLDVLVDGILMGQTPWEGVLAAGDHMVILRGDGALGTAPVAARVKARVLTTLSLRAEQLDAVLRVDPTPAGASVAIDAVPLGRGTWEGSLRSGAHQVEVRAEGFVSVNRSITLTSGQQERLSIALQRDEDAEVWQLPSKITVDVSTGFALVPSFGGDVAGDCGGDCSRSMGLGGVGLVHVGYEFGSGLGIGAALGYLIAVQETTERTGTIVPVGLSPRSGKVDDQLRLDGFLAGATIGYRIGESTPLLLRLGAGVVIGSVRDERSGSFPVEGGGTFETYPVADASFATYGYLDPEVRVSTRVGEHWELGAGVQALLLVGISQPKFDDELELAAPGPAIGTYPDDALTGGAVLVLAPSVSARYTF